MRQVLILLVIAAVGVTAYLFRADLPPQVQAVLGLGETTEATAPPPPQRDPPTVTVAEVLVEELVEWDEFSGRFTALEEVELRARVGGYLQEVRAGDGALVEKGDVLFVIDQRSFQLALERTKANVARAEADLQFAEQELARAQDLVRRNAASLSTLDERARERASAVANLDSARVEVQQAELDLDFTTVKAPFDGRVSDRRVDVGNLIDSSTVLTTIVRIDPIDFEFDVTEDVLLAYRRAVAQGVLPSLQDESGGAAVRPVDVEHWPYPARIDFIDNVVDAGSGTVRLRAVLDNKDGLILPGQFGYIRVPGSPRYPAILVPDDAITSDQANKILLTLDADNVVVPKIVDPGPREYGLRIIRRGLEPGDRIIVNGLFRARPGSPVTPEETVIELWPNGAPGNGES